MKSRIKTKLPDSFSVIIAGLDAFVASTRSDDEDHVAGQAGPIVEETK